MGLRKQKALVRRDVEIISVQPNLDLVVYWKVLRIGKGPAVVVETYGNEILKFDCFGKGEGHYHVAPNFGERIFFEKPSAMDQIDLTVMEIEENLQTHLKNQREPKINQLKVDLHNLALAVDHAKLRMVHFLETVPELKELR